MAIADMATTLNSYDLKGVKESFANWISNISPTDTPFVSMTGKESITNKYFQWQTDALAPVDPDNAYEEGSDAADVSLTATTVLKNVTQILRKVVKVSDTADALSSYGRGSELAYQMEKAGAEIKRDLEHAFLNNGVAKDLAAPGTSNLNDFVANGGTYDLGMDSSDTPVANTGVRVTKGFVELVGKGNAPEGVGVIATEVKEGETGEDTNVKVGSFSEETLFGLTENLYTVGATPNIIMFHPKHAKTFSALAERNTDGHNRQRMFDGETATVINTYVSTLVDPLGQEFKLIPNRFMPQDRIYIFNPSDWTQMVLRAPTRVKLAKSGSFEKWMIEMEVGLRHRNIFASGVLNVKAAKA